MKEITTENLLKRNPSIYKLTNMVIKRAMELNKKISQTDTGKNQRPIAIALDEILEGKILYKGK